MASWSQLPSDFKKSVVDHLDLLSRNRLKICSKSDQKLVNSVPLTIKNARIGVTDTHCLLVVHTGIDEFLKLNLQKFRDKVIIKRSLNTHQLGERSKKVPLKGKHLLSVVFPFVISLLNSPTKNIFINTLEWEYKGDDNMYETLGSLSRSVRLPIFRAKTLVSNFDVPVKVFGVLYFMCDDDLEEVIKRGLKVDGVEALPLSCYDVYQKDSPVDKPMCYSYLHTSSRMFLSFMTTPNKIPHKINKILTVRLLNSEPGSYVIHRDASNKYPAKALFEDLEPPTERVTPTMLVKRQIYPDQGPGGIVHRFTLSPCGFWIAAVRLVDEPTIDWKSMECCLREYCSKCSDAFERNYFFNLPRRFIDEPFGSNVIEMELEPEFQKMKGVYKKGVIENLKKSLPWKGKELENERNKSENGEPSELLCRVAAVATMDTSGAVKKTPKKPSKATPKLPKDFEKANEKSPEESEDVAFVVKTFKPFGPPNLSKRAILEVRVPFLPFHKDLLSFNTIHLDSLANWSPKIEGAPLMEIPADSTFESDEDINEHVLKFVTLMTKVDKGIQLMTMGFLIKLKNKEGGEMDVFVQLGKVTKDVMKKDSEDVKIAGKVSKDVEKLSKDSGDVKVDEKVSTPSGPPNPSKSGTLAVRVPLLPCVANSLRPDNFKPIPEADWNAKQVDGSMVIEQSVDSIKNEKDINQNVEKCVAMLSKSEEGIELMKNGFVLKLRSGSKEVNITLQLGGFEVDQPMNKPVMMFEKDSGGVKVAVDTSNDVEKLPEDSEDAKAKEKTSEAIQKLPKDSEGIIFAADSSTPFGSLNLSEAKWNAKQVDGSMVIEQNVDSIENENDVNQHIENCVAMLSKSEEGVELMKNGFVLKLRSGSKGVSIALQYGGLSVDELKNKAPVIMFEKDFDIKVAGKVSKPAVNLPKNSEAGLFKTESYPITITPGSLKLGGAKWNVKEVDGSIVIELNVDANESDEEICEHVKSCMTILSKSKVGVQLMKNGILLKLNSDDTVFNVALKHGEDFSIEEQTVVNPEKESGDGKVVGKVSKPAINLPKDSGDDKIDEKPSETIQKVPEDSEDVKVNENTSKSSGPLNIPRASEAVKTTINPSEVLEYEDSEALQAEFHSLIASKMFLVRYTLITSAIALIAFQLVFPTSLDPFLVLFGLFSLFSFYMAANMCF